jgi:hypothetical protein
VRNTDCAARPLSAAQTCCFATTRFASSRCFATRPLRGPGGAHDSWDLMLSAGDMDTLLAILASSLGSYYMKINCNHHHPPESGDRIQPGELADSLCITRSDICQAIKAAAVANGDKAASYSSHSGRIGGATLLLQAGASVATIKLAGRWKGDTWSIYSRMTGTAMYGVAADMIGESSRKQVSADNVRVR